MATQVSNYYISDREVCEETVETMEALDELMYKVGQIPGIVVAAYDTPEVIHGTKIVIRKETIDA